MGRQQVEILRSRLVAEENVAAVYSSPLRRAVETARAAPPHLIPRIRLLDSLAEIHCGTVEGMPIEDIKRLYPDLWARNEAQNDDQFRWPGGETYRRFRRRVLRVVRRIAARHGGERVLIFTHAGVINQILGTLVGQRAAKWENLRPGNTSITEVCWNETVASVEVFDDRSHLERVHA